MRYYGSRGRQITDRRGVGEGCSRKLIAEIQCTGRLTAASPKAGLTVKLAVYKYTIFARKLRCIGSKSRLQTMISLPILIRDSGPINSTSSGATLTIV